MSIIDNPEFESYLKQSIKKYFQEKEEKERKVSSQEYIDWIYSYVSTNGGINDEEFLYSEESIDKENADVLEYFLDYIEKLAVTQRVLVVTNEDLEFGEEVVVKIKDKYFNVFRMQGQGSWTYISLLENEPDYCYVKISNMELV